MGWVKYHIHFSKQKLLFKSFEILFLFTISLFNPFIVDLKAIRVCAKGTPMFLKTVLSVRSL